MAHDEEEVESNYKRRIGIALATLAVLAAFIAFIQTGASSNEASSARDATRLASESETADVLSKGTQSGLEQIEAELGLLGEREVFGETDDLAAQFGVELDPQRAEARSQNAEDRIGTSLGERSDLPAQLSIEAERLSLEQQLVVEQRVSWNAKSSQYDTVLTVLAVAIFLIGFTLVVGRNLRPPLAIPGLVLALICAGWALQIYTKPTPSVSQETIDATAEGRHLQSFGDPFGAIAQFDAALESTPDYPEALTSRSLARVLAANPDLSTTLAFTDTSPDVLEAAAEDVAAAIDNGADEDPTAWAVASIIAVADRDWDAAAEYLEEGIRLNELAAELFLWRSAVATAQGDRDAALDWLQRARDNFGNLGEERIRTLAAQYLTLLEFVSATEPDQADLAAEVLAIGVESLSRGRKDGALLTGASPSASIVAAMVGFADGVTSTNVELDGINDGDLVVVAVFEDPGAGNGWVQSPELFYSGPGGAADREGGISIPTPRNCEPTAHRVDLYVEGEFRDSVVVEGGTATC